MEVGAPIIPCSPANCNRSRNSPVRRAAGRQPSVCSWADDQSPGERPAKSRWASALRVKPRGFAFQQGITQLAWSHSPCSRSRGPAQERTASEAPASYVGLRRQEPPSSAFRGWSLGTSNKSTRLWMRCLSFNAQPQASATYCGCSPPRT